MKCCSKCQDFASCEERSGCCKYCDFFSPSGCTYGLKTNKVDRLAEYERLHLTPSEFGDFFNAD